MLSSSSAPVKICAVLCALSATFTWCASNSSKKDSKKTVAPQTSLTSTSTHKKESSRTPHAPTDKKAAVVTKNDKATQQASPQQEAVQQKKESKNKQVAAKKKSKTFSEMDYSELKEEKQKLLAKGNREIAIKYIEKMVPLCSDLGELSDLMLELADLLFDAGELAKAERLYAEFASMYPGHQKAEYASYKAIICSYWETLDSQRDQSKTKETIERAESFLKNKAAFTTYADQVDEILFACREKLLESEISIFHYYMHRKDYVAAQSRLDNIEKEMLPVLPTKEPVIISLACELAEQQHNLPVLEEKRTLLAQKFPDFVVDKPTVVATAAPSTAKPAVDRF